jgi:hypothetical protein
MDTRYRVVAEATSFSCQMARTDAGLSSLARTSGRPFDTSQQADGAAATPPGRRHILAPLTALLILLTCCSQAAAEKNWAAKMFDHASHNFGVVAKGAKVEHSYPFTNIYEEDVVVVSTTSSCGCSSVKASKTKVKKFETAEIMVSLDTRRFSKRKDATITVGFQFEKPTDEGLLRSRKVEVQLQVYSYIRQDVVLTPGLVQFGSVRKGTASQKVVNLAYAGSDTWQITEIISDNPYILVQATQTSRGNGLVNYRIQVDLKDDAPVAYIREHVTLVTNDDNPNAKRVMMTVEGVVESAISISPSPLILGTVQPDEVVVKKIVLMAAGPFNVLAVVGPDERFECTVPEKASRTQILRIEFTPDARRGPFDGKITIQTDITSDQNLEVPLNGRVGSAEQDTQDTSQEPVLEE